jgi:ABC-type glutathione transport system ATPase component
MPSTHAVAETVHANAAELLLEVRGLTTAFHSADGQQREAVSGLDIRIHKGERVALVGESGSGKTVSALSILGLLPEAHCSGEVLWRGSPCSTPPRRGVGPCAAARSPWCFKSP